ncbi:N-formylglutamate amidohydrolase [Bizionia argentinensis JUB59]|uniref:N-formylglutamate amidohydrolase n=1 Tax=Bizionia argentinensis JUB59 TaxID=1046627 RepID=G2EAA3_9FLAO|nr:N-formylglutamate amidohydrolase [Bizionia argentinensis]EGV44662.1 N-formylglutamate amidohydrolase [Bizionia argentinensis JUB59]
MKIVLTCEHGGNDVPTAYQSLFINAENILNSHRGYDLGALDLFKALIPLSDFSKYSTTSRLLIELNRSLHHNNLFSEFSRNISKAAKQTIINEFYKPYRDSIESEISKCINQGEIVLHISVHSFTPIWNNKERLTDIGLLYDSKIYEEKQFCKILKAELLKRSAFKIRYNQPYLGKSDGFTSYLRKQFPNKYIGVEVEINQKFSKNNQMSNELKNAVLMAIEAVN